MQSRFLVACVLFYLFEIQRYSKRTKIMDRLINDFSKFALNEFELDFKPNELKKIIGNNSVMFKTFQIIMLKFKSKHNGELIRRKLELDEKKSKLIELENDFNKLQSELIDLTKVINERKIAIKNDNQTKEFYKSKQLRTTQLIKLIEQVLKSTETDIDTTSNLDKIDKTINHLNLKINPDEINEEKLFIPPQSNYNLVEKHIDEFIKDINGSIFEISELMKNEDFALELEDDFNENLTRTDYKSHTNEVHENVEIKQDKRLLKLTKHYETYKERIESLYNKHKNKVYELIKKVEEQTSLDRN